MKVLILCFLIGYILPFSPDKCAAEALAYCDYKFHWSSSSITQIGFIQICMREGGLELDCLYTSSPHSDGTLENLQYCLVKKGWKVFKKRPQCFKAGYPLVIEFDDIAPIYPSYLAIATYVDANTIKYSMRHPNICDAELPNKTAVKQITYFCPV